jgi:hypothetical protein
VLPVRAGAVELPAGGKVARGARRRRTVASRRTAVRPVATARTRGVQPGLLDGRAPRGTGQ